MQRCKRLVPSRLHEFHESKFPFVSRLEFICSKLSNVSAPVSGGQSSGRPAVVPSRVERGTVGSAPAGRAERALRVWVSGVPERGEVIIVASFAC